MYKRILVPTDGSSLSQRAIRSAVDLAATVGAEVVGMSVVPCYPTSFFTGGSHVSADEVGRVEKEWADRGQALADQVGEAAQSAGVRARSVTVCSDRVADAILAAARKHHCDLVVMGSHCRKGLTRLLLGSETEHVVANGAIPVLVLH